MCSLFCSFIAKLHDGPSPHRIIELFSGDKLDSYGHLSRGVLKVIISTTSSAQTTQDTITALEWLVRRPPQPKPEGEEEAEVDESKQETEGKRILKSFN